MLAINTCKSRRGQKGLGRVPGSMWGTALAILESARSLSLTVHAAITVRGVPTRASCAKQNRKEAVTMHTPLESMYNTMHHTLRKSFQQVGIKVSR